MEVPGHLFGESVQNEFTCEALGVLWERSGFLFGVFLAHFWLLGTLMRVTLGSAGRLLHQTFKKKQLCHLEALLSEITTFEGRGPLTGS